MGPNSVLARTAPNLNTYRLAVPPTWRAFDEFNASVQFNGSQSCVGSVAMRRTGPLPSVVTGDSPVRRRPHWQRPQRPMPPMVGANGQVEHEVAKILKFRVTP